MDSHGHDLEAPVGGAGNGRPHRHRQSRRPSRRHPPQRLVPISCWCADHMDTHDTTSKLTWEAPATVALTDTDSRADQADVALRNGFPSSAAR